MNVSYVHGLVASCVNVFGNLIVGWETCYLKNEPDTRVCYV